MTPSNNEPVPQLLLSPPVPRIIPPSCFIGAQPLGRGRSYHVDRPPDWALPPLSAKVVFPSFFSSAVTKSLLFPRLARFVLSAPMNRPFSMSACTQGPFPLHCPPVQHVVLRLTASMCPAPLSSLLASALPKSKQQFGLAWVPEATIYIPSGSPLIAIPLVLLFR